MKKLRYMNKDELLDVFKEFDIPLPDADEDGKLPTNDELRDDLQVVYDITDDKIKAWEEKKDAELRKDEPVLPLEDDDGNIIICMDRDNLSFGYGKYTFSKSYRYQVVDAETARVLLNEYDGFHRATREELKLVFDK